MKSEEQIQDARNELIDVREAYNNSSKGILDINITDEIEKINQRIKILDWILD